MTIFTICLIIGTIYFYGSFFTKFKKPKTKREAESVIADFFLGTFCITLLGTGFSNNSIYYTLFLIIILCPFIIYLKEELKTMYKDSLISISKFVLPLVLIKIFIIDVSIIPTSSMRPTVKPGSVMLVGKLGSVSIPILNETYYYQKDVYNRGDIIGFYEPKLNMFLSKRLIGLEGDKIVYTSNKDLYINNIKVIKTPTNETQVVQDFSSESPTIGTIYKTSQGHDILITAGAPWINESSLNNQDCSFTESKMTCIVTKGKAFVMGDNWDGSYDSRYWGFLDMNRIQSKKLFLLKY